MTGGRRHSCRGRRGPRAATCQRRAIGLTAAGAGSVSGLQLQPGKRLAELQREPREIGGAADRPSSRGILETPWSRSRKWIGQSRRSSTRRARSRTAQVSEEGVAVVSRWSRPGLPAPGRAGRRAARSCTRRAAGASSRRARQVGIAAQEQAPAAYSRGRRRACSAIRTPPPLRASSAASRRGTSAGSWERSASSVTRRGIAGCGARRARPSLWARSRCRACPGGRRRGGAARPRRAARSKAGGAVGRAGRRR